MCPRSLARGRGPGYVSQYPRGEVDPMVAMDETQLVARAADGDPDAYGQLFERYQKRIYNYAYGIAGDPDDAKDVAQDAFIKVYEALPRLRERVADRALPFVASLST